VARTLRGGCHEKNNPCLPGGCDDFGRGSFRGFRAENCGYGREARLQPWSDQVFSDAKRTHRFVLLDLEAVWCHWCHVMDANTYSDPKVIKLLQSRYIVVKVDQDSRPDLSNRYEDYGWPATVVSTEAATRL